MYVFNADGTLQQANPDAGDARTSDSDGKGIWVKSGDRIKCKWMEVVADRTTRKYAGRLEVSCDLQVAGDAFSGTETVSVFDAHGTLTEGPTKPRLKESGLRFHRLSGSGAARGQGAQPACTTKA
jgi:hypothetical protein